MALAPAAGHAHSRCTHIRDDKPLALSLGDRQARARVLDLLLLVSDDLCRINCLGSIGGGRCARMSVAGYTAPSGMAVSSIVDVRRWMRLLSALGLLRCKAPREIINAPRAA